MILDEADIQKQQHARAHVLAEGIFLGILDELQREGSDYTPGAILLALEMLTVAMRGFVVHFMGVEPQDLAVATLRAAGCSEHFKEKLEENRDLFLAYQMKLEEDLKSAMPNVPGGEA